MSVLFLHFYIRPNKIAHSCFFVNYLLFAKEVAVLNLTEYIFFRVDFKGITLWIAPSNQGTHSTSSRSWLPPAHIYSSSIASEKCLIWVVVSGKGEGGQPIGRQLSWDGVIYHNPCSGYMHTILSELAFYVSLFYFEQVLLLVY